MFSNAEANFVLKHLSGRAYFETTILRLTEEYRELKNTFPDFKASFILFNFLEKINTDINSFLPSILDSGFSFENVLEANTYSEVEILSLLQKYSEDVSVHGICVCQIPSKEKFNEEIAETIIPIKDVAGVSNGNFMNSKAFFPTITVACVESLRATSLVLSESKAVIIGEANEALQITNLLLHNNATVTICSSCNAFINAETQDADIVIIMPNKSAIIPSLQLKKGAALISYCMDTEKELNTMSASGDNLNPPTYIAYLSDLVLTAIALALKNTFISAKKSSLHCNSEWNFTPNPLKIEFPVKSDIQIARSQLPRSISILAKEMGLLPHEIEPYGKYKAKVSLDVFKRLCSDDVKGKYVVVSGMTPTQFGEGKSTTTIGLCQALGAHLNKNVIACVRQPSQGPTFGIKGGAAGGGYAQVIPMEEFNLHLTGDIHAVTAANNLLAAQIDARMFHEGTQSDQALYKRLVPEVGGSRKFSKIQIARLEKLGIFKTDPSHLTEEEIKLFVRLDIDPTTITWQRVLDTNDRFLRKIKVGLSSTEQGHEREAQFDITVASEVMAILALSTGLKDLKNRLSKIVVARDRKGNPVTANDLGVTGAMAVLLKDAIKPNLMQTLEGTPVFVHAGPFANIAHGNSSIIADNMALKVVGNDGFVVTEAGFGADIGLEKFFHIKCRYSGLVPDVVVLVATVRALKMHGGASPVTNQKLPLSSEQLKEQLQYIEKGFCNLAKHIENVKKFGVPVIVAVNRFGFDHEDELELVKALSMSCGVEACVICNHFCEGGAGAVELAGKVVKASQLSTSDNFTFLYNLQDPILDKMNAIAKEVYGASGVTLAPQAIEMISLFEKEGLDKLPICMAKTQYSFSHDPQLKGAPQGFLLPIRDIKASVGAGFLYPLVGTLMLMPGLPTRPCFYDMDIDEETEEIEGLS